VLRLDHSSKVYKGNGLSSGLSAAESNVLSDIPPSSVNRSVVIFLKTLLRTYQYRGKTSSEVIMVEVRMLILDLDLLDSPPGRECIGDMVVSTFHHPRVKYANHLALAIKDK
jgi:hypothetical protein